MGDFFFLMIRLKIQKLKNNIKYMLRFTKPYHPCLPKLSSFKHMPHIYQVFTISFCSENLPVTIHFFLLI